MEAQLVSVTAITALFYDKHTQFIDTQPCLAHAAAHPLTLHNENSFWRDGFR